jgi:hypothetical protein
MTSIFASLTTETRCRTCRWWFPTSDLNGDGADPMCGTCQRYAPDHNGWPITSPNQSCGDWTYDAEK